MWLKWMLIWWNKFKEIICIKIECNSQRISLKHQHDRHFFVLEHQHGCRDFMWKRSIWRMMSVCMDTWKAKMMYMDWSVLLTSYKILLTPVCNSAELENNWCSNVHTIDDDFHSNSLVKESTTTATLIKSPEIYHFTNLLLNSWSGRSRWGHLPIWKKGGWGIGGGGYKIQR